MNTILIKAKLLCGGGCSSKLKLTGSLKDDVEVERVPTTISIFEISTVSITDAGWKWHHHWRRWVCPKCAD